MKRTKFSLLAAFAIFACANANAGGIPVIDAASLANSIASQVETIAKWAQQYAQMAAQIEQAQQQFNSMNGSRGLGNVSNGGASKFQVPDAWAKVSGKSLPGYAAARQQYPTDPDYPKRNVVFDTQASQEATMQAIYASTIARTRQVDALLSQINSATDPAAKADLQNRLINEQNAIQAYSQVLASISANQANELKAASAAADKEYVCKQFKKDNC